MSDMLAGLKIADLTIVTAGAGATQVLADFGADVVKIEGVDRPDLYRGGFWGGQGGDLDSPPFRTANRNKRGLAVDLKTPEGREVVRRLVAESDVVTENFRRGAAERLGLGFLDLIEIRSNAVLVSISSQGATGPDRFFTSFGITLDALGGVMSLSGYDEDAPTWSSGRVNYPDQTANTLAPAIILAAVMAARRDGRPRWIDLSQREVVTSLLGDQVLATSLGAPDPVPMGNSSPGRTEWLSRAVGDDQWIAVGVGSREEEDHLAAVVGTDLAALGDAAGRAAALRVDTDRWAAGRSPADGARALRSGGVAAVAVRSGEELLDDPYLREQGWWQPVDRPDGTVEQQRGWAVRFAEGGPAAIRQRAPHHGEHTDAVLAELGYSADEIRELTERGIVTTPQATQQREART
jgi:crotonobetainyl-CoA:carnitine CoA-transferase CaiB-like acyl-CoA transferase